MKNNNWWKEMIYTCTFICLAILNGCSTDGLEGDGDDPADGGSSLENYAPASVQGKTLAIEGQLFYVIFQTGTGCKVVPEYSWETITNTPTYTYRKTGDNTATLTLSYKDKIASGTAYTLSDTTYNLTLNFTALGKGTAVGTWKGYTTINTGIGGSSTSKYLSGKLNNKSFTLN